MSFQAPHVPAYAELQATTNFSFLRGGSHGEELVATAKALGLAGLAITDRNTLAGVVRAHAAAKEIGLRLVVGARLDLSWSGTREAGLGNDHKLQSKIAEGRLASPKIGSPIDPPIDPKVDLKTRQDCTPNDIPAPPGWLESLLCLPTDRAAYGRLCQLLTLGQRRAGKGRCTIFLEDVVAHSAGQILIALPPVDWNWREGLRHLEKGARSMHGQSDTGPSQPARHRLARLHPAAPCPPENLGPVSDGLALSTFADQLSSLGHALQAAGQSSPQPRSAPPRLYLAASHGYRGDDRVRIAALDRLAVHCGTPLVATGDVLYHAPDRRPLQDVVTCIREKCTLADAGWRLEANAERHLKSPGEMTRLFKGCEAALARTVQILEACRFSLDEIVYEYPDEPVPPGTDPQSHLEALTWAGAAERYPPDRYPGGVPDEVRQTLVKELGLISQLAYAPYFLTVHDIVCFARSQDILCQGRGSAANSAVCYCLGITNVDPVEIDLLFDRFITPERKEPPDIDVDFEHERREEVIQYIYGRYGRERAGLAATVISYRARSAVREVGKVMGLSADTVAGLAGMVWGSYSGESLPQKHIREAGLDPDDPRLARVVELTSELIGFPRHLSQHVGGFVLTRTALSQIVPIGNAAMIDRTCIEWDKDDLDSVGLLKVDVLGLGMLTCIRRAFDLIGRHHRRRLTLATVPQDDEATYEMLCRADSIGVFQVESRAQMNMLPRLKPRCFYDLVIEVAIVRPGPIQGNMVHPYLRRRDGLEAEHYPSPDPRFGHKDELRQILGKTKGVPLFQEQAMRIAMTAAEFTAAEVNQLRKAMATFRRRGTIGLLEDKMISRMVGRGYERAFAERCFDQIKGFGEYGFPESHAASFAHLVYVSAWLKCHYPHAFAAALLNSQPMGFYAPAQIVRDAQEHGVEARAADINHSDWDSTLEEVTGDRGQGTGKENETRKQEREKNRRQADRASPCHLSPVPYSLRLGLRQIDGMREDEVEKIVAARRDGIPVPWNLSPVPSFRSVQDLWARAGVQLATLERLAAADAFRSIGLDRRQALWEVKALGAAKPLPLFEQLTGDRLQVTGMPPEAQVPFPVTCPLDPVTSPYSLPAMGLSEHVVNDYQTTRLSLKAHPMRFLRDRLAVMGVKACAELKQIKDGATIAVAGIILVRQRPGSAKGVVFMTIEDETGIANAVIWPKTLERFRKVVMGARLVHITGRIQRHESIIHVVAQRLEDRSGWLALLSEDGAHMPIPIANADEVLRPDPGSARDAAGGDHPRFSRRHPRDVRILPKSRDFH